MSLVKRILIAQGLLVFAILPQFTEAQTTIAHRGLFHNSVQSYNSAENTAYSVQRAKSVGGLGGAEVDLRESSDGVLMVTHDQVSNRTTEYDNYDGVLNPVYVAIGSQPQVSALHISGHTSSQWQNTELKWYGPGATLITGRSYMPTLNDLISGLKNSGDLANGFKLILDIQDPDVFNKAAETVTALQVQGSVYLKFFAKSALYDNLKYDGADTCYVYMEQNHLADPKLQIIPQINDGELDIIEDDNSGINIWGTTLTIPEYLDCWNNARAQHNNVAYMPIVSASVPANNDSATTAATEALDWASANGRQTMSIVPNPDACNVVGNASRQYSFSSTNVAANTFDYTKRTAKANFVAKYKPTYVIADVMGIGSGSWTTDITSYNSSLCYE